MLLARERQNKRKHSLKSTAGRKMDRLLPYNKAHAKRYCHVRAQSMAIYSARNMSSVWAEKWLIGDTREIGGARFPARKSPNLAAPPQAKSRLPRSTAAHFGGFNSRYDTLLVVHLRVTYVRSSRVLACNHVRPPCSVTSDVDDVAFPTSTSNMRAYARLAEWACTRRNAVTQSFEPRRVDHDGRTWRGLISRR